MKRLLSIVLLLIAFTNPASAQSFIRPNATWCYYSESFYLFQYDHYAYSADTIIDNLSAKVITHNTRNYYYDDNMIVHLSATSTNRHYFRESNDTVWAYVNGQFHIQYIFNALPGDTWPTNGYQSCNNTYMQVADTISTHYNNELLKGLQIRKVSCEYGWPWPEAYENVYFKIGPQTTLFSTDEWPMVDSSMTYCASQEFVSYHDIDNPIPNEAGNYCQFIGVGIDENTPITFSVLYPNPASTTTTFEYALKENTDFSIRIIDSMGRVIKTINKGNQAEGLYKETIDVSHYQPGIYFLKVNESTGKKLIVK